VTVRKIKQHKCKEIDWCICDHMQDTPNEDCLKHGFGGWPPRCADCGRFMSLASRERGINMEGGGNE